MSCGAIAATSPRDPAETFRHLMFEAARRHQLHADANAEKGLAFHLHRFGQRVDHAGDIGEAAFAIGKGADARQHDALGAAHSFGIAADADRHRKTRLARGTLESLMRGVQIARAIIDDDRAHLRVSGSGKTPMTSACCTGTGGGGGGGISFGRGDAFVCGCVIRAKN